MASVNGLNRLGLPKLSENMDPEDARALRSYLYQMQEQLQYVLPARPARSDGRRMHGFCDS